MKAGDEVRMTKDTVEIRPFVGSDEIRSLIERLIRGWRELSRRKAREDARELRDALKALSVRKTLDQGQMQEWRHPNPDSLADDGRNELLAGLRQLADTYL